MQCDRVVFGGEFFCVLEYIGDPGILQLKDYEFARKEYFAALQKSTIRYEIVEF